MKPRIISDSKQLQLTLTRLAHQLIENHKDFSNSVIIGVQPRGVLLAERIHRLVSHITGRKIESGKLDITFHRDDVHLKGKPMLADDTDIRFSLEGKRVVLVDDVLYTGRTIRAALDAMLALGRPEDVELLVLIDRRLHRDVPIQAKYAGKVIDSIQSEKVKVEWAETDGADKVWIVEDAKAIPVVTRKSKTKK